jgi:hypothetical protein
VLSISVIVRLPSAMQPSGNGKGASVEFLVAVGKGGDVVWTQEGCGVAVIGDPSDTLVDTGLLQE